ncbi:MAG: hypothetical protein V8S34_03885 [Lawsonibacter sp.]
MILYICNTAAVGLFGIILSAAFCNIRWDRKNVLWMAAATVAIYILQAVVYFGIDTTQGQYLSSHPHPPDPGHRAVYPQPPAAVAGHLGPHGLSVLPAAAVAGPGHRGRF